MLLTLFTATAVAVAPNKTAQYDVFLGMPEHKARDVRMMMTSMQPDVWKPSVATTAKVGSDTLVMWTWPLKGNHGIGLQIYGLDGKFKTWLEDSHIPSAKAVVCNNRYVVGGGNTLRVWDASQSYKLVNKRAIAGGSQFANLSCDGNLLSQDNDTRMLRLLVPSLSPVDMRLGLSSATVVAINRSTLNHLDESHAVTQTLTTPAGDTLVAWARTPGYDPKGPRSVGVQVYGADGNFKTWLKDSAVERPMVLCGRYLVGGDNTLRVWDTAAGFKLLARQPVRAQNIIPLQCAPDGQSVALAGKRLSLPALAPLR